MTALDRRNVRSIWALLAGSSLALACAANDENVDNSDGNSSSNSSTSSTAESTNESSGENTSSSSTPTDATDSTTDSIQMAIDDLIATDADCQAIYPLYWELGDANGLLFAGSAGEAPPSRETAMLIASASKWIFAAAVAETKHGTLAAADIEKLNFTSGYHSFDTCLPLANETVNRCLERGDNGLLTSEDQGKFFYNGGHMQKLASDLGWGEKNNETLAAQVNLLLHAEPAFEYQQVQPAGGIRWSAAGYGHFLRQVMRGELAISSLLGTNAVCTHPLAPKCNALFTPIPLTESWTYSLGHWVESDPKVGDFAVSSAGKFGFYPWIDARRQAYGIVAREDRENEQAGYASALCGRKIRALWASF